MLWFPHSILCFITIILSYAMHFPSLWNIRWHFPFSPSPLPLLAAACSFMEQCTRDNATATLLHIPLYVLRSFLTFALSLTFLCACGTADSLAYRFLLWTHSSSSSHSLGYESPSPILLAISFRIRSKPLERTVSSCYATLVTTEAHLSYSTGVNLTRYHHLHPRIAPCPLCSSKKALPTSDPASSALDDLTLHMTPPRRTRPHASTMSLAAQAKQQQQQPYMYSPPSPAVPTSNSQAAAAPAASNTCNTTKPPLQPAIDVPTLTSQSHSSSAPAKPASVPSSGATNTTRPSPAASVRELYHYSPQAQQLRSDLQQHIHRGSTTRIDMAIRPLMHPLLVLCRRPCRAVRSHSARALMRCYTTALFWLPCWTAAD